MRIEYPQDMVGRKPEWNALTSFVESGEPHATLGVVWGRRRVGKSFLLESITDQTNGFYYESVRGSSGEALNEVGRRLADFQGSPAPLALPDWNSAIQALLALGRHGPLVVALDEYPYLLEHTPELDSIIQRAFGPRSPTRLESQARLILCGSAMSVMGKILSGTAPLRGRAGMDLRVSPFDFRQARHLHDIADLPTAFRTFSVIGGVAAYAREMVDSDLPGRASEFDQWICRRVLSPSAPLFNEVALLLSEDPATSKARKINLYHAALAGVATGNRAHGKLTNYVKISGVSLTTIIEALVAAELIERMSDPIRENRPTYHPADSLIRFHYAVIRLHQGRLSRHDTDTLRIWEELRPTFDSQVVGPSFEAAARYWTRYFAEPATLGGRPDHIGTSTIALADGEEREVDVLVAADDSDVPANRTVLAIGEAKLGEVLTDGHLKRLEAIRDSLGPRARDAKLLLFGGRVSRELERTTKSRDDVELVDWQRLYMGS
jgi:uncharacterized protein